MENISVVIPIRDVQIDIHYLLSWVSEVLYDYASLYRYKTFAYEILLIIANTEALSKESSDYIQYVSAYVPVSVHIIQKVSSLDALAEIGYAMAQYTVIAKIDADYQIPTEIVSDILKKIHSTTDVIAVQHVQQETGNRSKIGTCLSVSDKFLYTLQMNPGQVSLFFRKPVWETVHSSENTQAGIVEFLHRAREAGFCVEHVVLNNGFQSKQSFGVKIARSISAGFRFGVMKLRKIQPLFIPSENPSSMLHAGIGYKRRKYITHTTLRSSESALKSFEIKQILFMGIIVEIIILGIILSPLRLIQGMIGVLSTIYFIDVVFNFYIVLKTIRNAYEVSFSEEEIARLDNNLPVYTILCPLYKEAHMIPQFLQGITALDWPKEKLDVILLLEEDDVASIQAVRTMELFPYIRVLIVPHSLPKTKPKACNFGLSFAKGEYLVIYDAEDIPEPFQLKKAYLGFRNADRKIVCLQAKLNYYNSEQNLLTRFFTAEYALWFDITLTGLQSLQTTIPLGGTSNHFRTIDLVLLQAWDPFNVTEDADLGVRIFKKGYRTAILDSVTLEEANSQVANWLRQRSRWIKGYMQTYLVHTRNNRDFIRKKGLHVLIFHLVIGGKIAFIFINPLLWVITAAYFVLNGIFGPIIDAVYPPIVLYIAILSLIFGNYLYLFCYIIGCVKREQWGLIKYMYLIPVYWLIISAAGWIAFYQLLFKPHYWEKTVHGYHMQTGAQHLPWYSLIAHITRLTQSIKKPIPSDYFSPFHTSV